MKPAVCLVVLWLGCSADLGATRDAGASGDGHCACDVECAQYGDCCADCGGEGDGDGDGDPSPEEICRNGEDDDCDGTVDEDCPCLDEDVPDPAFDDADCDGFDGDPDSAIFVATSGDDQKPGTRDAPMRTLQAAIDAASAAGKDVYVSAGTYAGSIQLADGVSIFGGYDAADGWSRSEGSVVEIAGGTTAVTGSRLLGTVELLGQCQRAGGELGWAVARPLERRPSDQRHHRGRQRRVRGRRRGRGARRRRRSGRRRQSRMRGQLRELQLLRSAGRRRPGDQCVRHGGRSGRPPRPRVRMR